MSNIKSVIRNKYFQFLLLLLVTLCLYFIFCYVPSSLRANDRFIRYSLIMLFTLFGIIYIFVNIQRIYKISILAIVFMAGFSFISVPMYNALCAVTGINGKVDLHIAAGSQKGIDESREVTVEFVVSHNKKMPWNFKPQHTSLMVYPGELNQTGYFATNTTKKTMIAQAVPSISPSRASKYFKKVECFCFSSQKLGPGESANLGLSFYLDRDLPKDIKRITLSYTIFDVTADKDVQKMHEHHH